MQGSLQKSAGVRSSTSRALTSPGDALYRGPSGRRLNNQQLDQRPSSRTQTPIVRQAAPLVLCLDSLLDSSPDVIAMEMEHMSLDELRKLRAALEYRSRCG
jgi:hypothetical protein